MDAKEWEEEQVRLDRDWYSYDDEGAVVSRFVSLSGVARC
jgi:pre-mRNA-splicing factor ATP-dependent RNA helicase DHX38/PRP16